MRTHRVLRTAEQDLSLVDFCTKSFPNLLQKVSRIMNVPERDALGGGCVVTWSLIHVLTVCRGSRALPRRTTFWSHSGGTGLQITLHNHFVAPTNIP